MSLRSKFVSVFASALVLGSLSIAASAQDQAPAVKQSGEKSEKHEGRGHGGRGDFGRGMREGKMGGGMRGFMGIELTEAQKAQVKQIHEANRPDSAVMDELKSIREAQRGGTITDAQKARKRELRDQMRTKGESIHQQVLAVLTAEQRQQIETRKAEMQKRKQERREQRRQASPPAVDKSNDN